MTDDDKAKTPPTGDGATPNAGGAPQDDAGGASDGRDADVLRAKLAEAEAARDEMKNLAARTLADFQNYKARALKDAQASRRFAVKDAVLPLLPAVDNLERALASTSSGDAGALREGVAMTLRQLVDGFARLGVTRVPTAGAAFDPTSMEAVARVPAPDRREGSVVDEYESGWRMADLMVRPAKVSVAAPPPAEAPVEAPAEETSD
ncbi:MAG TPA: nucleotide exchange factor GrpE [Planctomycetota bacterium]|nr:nucleotide exchange factor GrpE [Planctomycetota bacterium]